MPGRLFHDDNLTVLREYVGDDSVDLVYLDPPFNSRRSYKLGRELDPQVVFSDTWPWCARVESGLEQLMDDAPIEVREVLRACHTLLGPSDLLAYLVMMAPRLMELHRVLAPHGSIYLHCDSSASHYLKILMDAIFGPECFLNNVVWLYGLGGSSPRRWPRKHDDLLWYARNADEQYFEAALIPATSRRMAGQDKKAPDYWDIPSLNNMARERVGYPTQKPEALLERIIASSSLADGVVLDPFVGSGTSVVVAERLGRSWIGIDQSPHSMDVTRERLAREFSLTVEVTSMGTAQSQ